ncbi:MAG: YfhO family protein [Candidatus Erginobacter occultus]|nr:YfhO family protein [Candidatus Erginobacter occultus]
MVMEKYPRILTWLTILILLGVVGSLLREAIFPPSPAFVLSRESGDVASLYYYWRGFGFGALRSGTIPLWNPAVFCGVPFAAYPESALFYPLNLVFLLLPLPTALNTSFIIHLGLLALFTFCWLRYTGSGRLPALLGSLALTGSGPVILHLTAGHLSNICTLAWVPLIFLVAENFFRTRKLSRAAGAGVLIGCQLLAGHWQYAYYTVLGLTAYAIGRTLIERRPENGRRLILPAGALLAGAAALGLAAVQILPALELAGDSFRQKPDIGWAAAFSLPPANLATFILPGWLGDSLTSLYRGENYFWEMCGYLGLIPLVLAAAALLFRRDRFTVLLAVLAGLAILVALGDSTPLFGVIYRVVPGFRFFRGHAKLLFFAAFFLATLAARGADRLFGRIRSGGPDRLGSRNRPRRLAVGGAAALLIAGAAALLFSLFASPEPPGWWRERIEGDLLRGRHYEIVPPGQPEWWERLAAQTPPDRDYPGYVRRLVGETPFPKNSWRTLRVGLGRLGLSAAALGLLGAAILFAPRRRRWWAAAVCLLAGGEIALWAGPYVTGFDSRVCRWDGEIAVFFAGREEPFRYLAFDPADYNRGMEKGFDSILGYQSDVPRRYLEYLNYSQGLPPEYPQLVPVVTAYSPLLDLLNARYFLIPPGAADGPDRFRKVLSVPGGEIRENPAAADRVLISGRGWVLPSPAEIPAALNRAGYRPEEEVFLEGEPPERFLRKGEAAPGEARITSRGINRVRVEAELRRDGVLLLNDSFAPGWKAYREGEEIPLYRANYLMRAVCLDQGEHQIDFRYRPLSFYLGAAVSLATLIALGIGLILSVIRRSSIEPSGNR